MASGTRAWGELILSVTYQMTELFFDRAAVVNAINRGERKALSKIGAFIRRRARSSLRKRKRTSSPGERPSIHSGDKVASLRNILFAFQPSTHSVIAGPVGLNQVNLGGDGSITIPALMEFGGSVAIREEQYLRTKTPSVWYRRDLRYRTNPDKRYRIRRADYAARPYMGPALAEEIAAGTIADAYAGVVHV